jgi:glycosyltransferase involved in cell wall biosynthesis
MKVIQVTPEFPPPLIGGGGYHVYNLTRELVRKGIEITVFTFNPAKDSSLMRKTVETQFGKVRVYRFPAFPIPRTIYPIAPSLIPYLLKEEPDIIHAHGYQFFTSDAAAIMSKIKKKPLILTLHGFPRGFSKMFHKAYFNLIGKRTLKTAKKIIAVSNKVMQEFKAIGVPEERITIIPNGVNLEEFNNALNGDNFRKSLNIKENEKLILSIGRLEEIKGFQYLIMALAKIQLETNPVKLVIAGPEFNYGSQLRKLIVETRMEDKVIFYGPIDGREKLEALAAADIAIVPSIYEGFSIFLLEAMASGKPVIATKTGIAPELIQNGKNGFLINSGDVEDLSEKIATILGNNQLSSLMSQECKNTVKAFDWGKISGQVLAIYNQSLKNV